MIFNSFVFLLLEKYRHADICFPKVKNGQTHFSSQLVQFSETSRSRVPLFHWLMFYFSFQFPFVACRKAEVYNEMSQCVWALTVVHAVFRIALKLPYGE